MRKTASEAEASAETLVTRTRSHIRSGRMSRREFVQLALAAGVSASTATSLFSREARAEPKKGGFFRGAIGNGSSTDTLDPATWGTHYYHPNMASAICTPLTQVDPKNAVAPYLAESFEAAESGKRWIFKLRKGVVFNNGKTLTAEDVVASINHHRGPDSKSGSKAGLEIVEDIKADGPETVIFVLKGPSLDFVYETSSYRLAAFPSKDGKIDFSNGGCGPFVIKKFDPGATLQATRNPNYFDAGQPYFDEVEMLVVPDASARANALVSGEIHYMDRCDLKTIGNLAGSAEIEVDNVTGFSHLVATINTSVAPFDNPDVRNALKYAIDREEFLQKILFGYGTIGNDNPFAPTLKFAIDAQPVHKYDPEMAKALLKKAGLDTLKIDLSTSNAAFDNAVDAAVLIQQSAAKCGIEINVVREAADSYWDAVWMKKPFMLSYWGGRPTIDQHATQAYSADAPYNDTFWKHPRFNELLKAARSEADTAKRAAMYAEMQQLLHDDGGQIVIAFNNYVSAHSKTVAHGELNSNLDHDGSYLWRRWWFA